MSKRLRLDVLEARDVPAVTLEQPHEAFTWVLINELRQDPAGFADKLDGLRRGTIDSAFGFSKTDPVVSDLRRLFQFARYPAHYGQALQTLRATGPLGPLGWDDVLEDRAGGHTEWMRTHSFEHTGDDWPTKWYVAGYNTGYRGGDPDDWGYSPGRYSWWGENIGYTYGMLPASKAAYRAGRFGRVGFEERAAFIDTVSYVVELNSPDLAHLHQLLAPDAGVPDRMKYNAIGIDLDFYEGPYEARDGVGEATLSTHRLGMYRPGGSGGFLTGVAYRDTNGNGEFDAGEGLAATLAVSGPQSFSDTIDRLGAHGVYSRFVPNGTYTVTATAADGTVLGTHTVVVQDSNAWLEFRAAGADSNLARATITAPLGTAGVRPTVIWGAVADALGYEVRLTNLTTGRVSLYPGATAAGPSWVPPTDLVPGHKYRAVVRPLFAHRDGEWSPPGGFTVGTPRVTGPGFGATTLRPTFSWESLPAATAYEIRVNDLTTGRVNIFPGQRTTATTWTAPFDLVSGRSYVVRVRAVNSLNQGTWGPAHAFSIGTPTLSGPVGDVSSRRPAFSWSAIDGTSRYVLVLDDLTARRAGVYRQVQSGTSWTPPTDLIDGHTYRWRVVAQNAAGLGRWSAVQLFRVV
jgi:hypothetical protein